MESVRNPSLPECYYPRANDAHPSSQEPSVYLGRPFDDEFKINESNVAFLLEPFDETAYEQHYVGNCVGEVADDPNASKGDLAPTLAQNEHLRLTILWYHMRGLLQDTATLRRMQDKVEILKDLIGWDHAICGLVDSDSFKRLFAAGLPPAVVPRRKSPCAHTVLQLHQSTLLLPNLVEDERFQNAPFVLEGGLRAYAGIQLRCSVQDGTDVALGSLCVSSEAVNQHLTQAQLDIMTKFADMLTEDLLNASRQRRARQQARNDDLIKSAMSRLPENLDEDAVLAILREVFVGAQVQVRHVLQETIQLEDDETTIPCGHSTSYWIWEDQNTINDFILTRNHEAQKTVQHAV